MPYELAPHHSGCPTDKPFGVVNQQTRRLEGCSATEDDAKKHLAALYANTSDTSQRAAASSRPWSDFPESKYSPEQYARACLIDSGTGTGKSRYSLPVREPDGTLNRNGMAAAAGRIGQTAVAPDKKKAAARKLVGLYRSINVDAPEELERLAGVSDSEGAADEAPAARGIAAVRGLVEERSATVTGVNFPQRTIQIIAVPYETEAAIDYRGELWREIFSRSAFRAINARARRIPVSTKFEAPSFDHVGARVVGKVTDANPNHPEGLLLDCRISKTPAGDETLSLADDEALSPSIGFIARGGDQVLDRQNMRRRVNRAYLDHLSFVPQPAYDGARIVAMRAQPADLSPIHTPDLDEFLADPVFNWANERLGD